MSELADVPPQPGRHAVDPARKPGPQSTVERLRAEVESLRQALSSRAAPATGPQDLFALLDSFPVPVLVLSPVQAGPGELVDFVIMHCNPDAVRHGRKAGGELIGARLFEIYPQLASNGLLRAFAEALRTRSPLELSLFSVESMVKGTARPGTIDVRAHPHGDSLIVAWRVHNSSVKRAPRPPDAAHLGEAGQAEWSQSPGSQEPTARREQVDRQREVGRWLRCAVLPAGREHLNLPGYQVAVRYLPAQPGSTVGGDWFEATELPDGHGVIAVGDVGGHGLEAAAGMARIGNALRGLALTGRPARQLLAWLNRVVYQEADPETIASVVIGRLDPQVPRLSWAQAGHLPPVLIRGGTARLLSPPSGQLLGVSPEPRYEQATEDLLPGDILLFYTDGLIERRDRPIDEGIAALLQAAEACWSAGTGGEIRGEVEMLLHHLGPASPRDDTCVLAVRVTG